VAQREDTLGVFRVSQSNDWRELSSVHRRCLLEPGSSAPRVPSPVPRVELNLQKSVPNKLICIFIVIAAGFCVLINGCSATHVGVVPSIEFTRIPPAEINRAEKFDIIQGRVTGARPGQQVVLYVKTGDWWVQPSFHQPFTKILADSTWLNSTHLGSHYAAVLVDPEYHPQSTMDTLPDIGGGVAAVAVAEGATSGPTTAANLQFGGYDWRVRNAPSSRGDTPNIYDPSNAWIDAEGALHLRIAKQGDQWTCAEVTLTRSLGYGTYSFVVRDTSQLEPASVFSMYTWDYSGGDQNNREMDIEISRWGDPAAVNAQCEVQPFYVPANVARFDAPAGVLTHSFRWEPGKVIFRTLRGSVNDSHAEVVNEHAFTSGVPLPASETVRIAFYVYGKIYNPAQNDIEVVVEKFEYLP